MQIGRWLRSLATLGVLVALIGYFAYHAISGHNGLQRHAALDDQIAALDRQLAQLRAERGTLESDVALLTGGARDHPELLEIEARRLLNFARPTDVVIVARPPARHGDAP